MHRPAGRTCTHCGTTKTPQWREGPAGPKTLCNACGIRYRRSQSLGVSDAEAPQNGSDSDAEVR